MPRPLSTNHLEASVRCRRRLQRRRCSGIVISYPSGDEHDSIYWHCPVCFDNGIITGWQGTLWDGFAAPAACRCILTQAGPSTGTGLQERRWVTAYVATSQYMRFWMGRRGWATEQTGRARLCGHYTDRLAEAGIEPSVGSVGDSYDKALDYRLYKTELIRQNRSAGEGSSES